MKLRPTPHPAISIKSLGDMSHGAPDIVFVSGHDGDPAKFIDERYDLLKGLLHDRDTMDHFAQSLEIARDANATDIMGKAAETLFKLSGKALVIYLVHFKWPRAVVDVNRWGFHNALGDLWGDGFEKDAAYPEFKAEMEQAHTRWLELLEGYLKVGCPMVDWHTMGPYPAKLKAGSFDSYVKGYHKILLVDRICLMTGLDENSNTDINQSVQSVCGGSDLFIENDPYGNGDRFENCTANSLMNKYPKQLASWDIPKNLIDDEADRIQLANSLAAGVWAQMSE